jgi:nucleotide-binding universal stress UspA family protein
MKSFLKNILVATDFSKTGNHVLEMAITLCKKNKAVLHLLHVVENRYIITAPEQGISLAEIASEIDTDARTNLYNIYETIMRSSGIAVQIHMPTGIPYDEICKAADEMPIDLIIIGTHGASGFRDFFMGTTAYNVIKNTTKPVLTIPESYAKPGFEKILFPVRPKQKIKEKFDYIQPFLPTAGTGEIHIAVLAKDKQEKDLLSNKEELYHIISLLKKSHIQHTSELYACGNFATKVLELALLEAADLVVINASLDYKWSQFFVGPYTQQVVNHAKVPVLSFRQAINVPKEIQKEEDAFLKKANSL